jgi:hypothetical protein
MTVPAGVAERPREVLTRPEDAGVAAGNAITKLAGRVYTVTAVRLSVTNAQDMCHGAFARFRRRSAGDADPHLPRDWAALRTFYQQSPGLSKTAVSVPSVWSRAPGPSRRPTAPSPARSAGRRPATIVFGDRGMVSNDMGMRGQQLIAFDEAAGFRAAGLRHQPVIYGRVVGALRDKVDAFLRAVLDETPAPVGLADARLALVLTAAAEASLAEGRPVAIAA